MYFVAFLLVLSWADYSYVQPASALSFVLIALLAHFVLHEIGLAHALGRSCADFHRVFSSWATRLPRTREHHSW